MLGSHLNLSLLKPLEAFYFIGGHLNQQRMVVAVSAPLFFLGGGGLMKTLLLLLLLLFSLSSTNLKSRPGNYVYGGHTFTEVFINFTRDFITFMYSFHDF